MVKSILEVLVNVILSSLTLESQMGVKNLKTGWDGVLGLEDELTEWLTIIGCFFTGVLLIH